MSGHERPAAETRDSGSPKAPLPKRGEVQAGNRRTTEPGLGASAVDEIVADAMARARIEMPDWWQGATS